MNKMIRIAIVDDDEGLRDTLQACVSIEPGLRCVSLCSSAAEALDCLPKEKPDVVLMDINMKGMDGIECTHRLKALLPHVHVIMLTIFEDADKIFAALSAGANGYLLKRLAPLKLADSIKEVIEGGSPMSAPIARKVVHYFHASKAATDECAHLTKREQEVLQGLAKGLAYKQICAQMGVSMSTVRTYIGRIYEKLHVHSRTEAVAKYVQR